MTHETFQLARGLHVPDLAGIREGYERKVARHSSVNLRRSLFAM